ncbi:MAG: dTMP kinase [Myxococcota bacterium]
MKRGRLIVFEGLDGCGKSTQLRRVAEALRERGLDPVVTREPTDGAWGRRIREMAQSGRAVAPETELAWFFEDRREHMRDVVRPALEAGRLVLSDRSYLSTVAYQGARGLDAAKILADSEAEFERPDCVLLFVIPAREGLARVAARGGVAEPVFENLEFLERVEAIFEGLDAGARADRRAAERGCDRGGGAGGRAGAARRPSRGDAMMPGCASPSNSTTISS